MQDAIPHRTMGLYKRMSDKKAEKKSCVNRGVGLAWNWSERLKGGHG